MKVIEFVGMARAGKTTQVNLLKSYLESKGFAVTVLTDRERALSLHTPPSEGLAYTLAFFVAAIETYYESLPKADYLLIDRGFYDATVWADVHFKLGDISQEECIALQTTFKPLTKLVYKTFYFKVPINVALARHEKTEHQPVDDVAMNNTWLKALEDSYEENLPTFINSTTIDGMQDPDTVAQKIIQEIE